MRMAESAGRAAIGIDPGDLPVCEAVLAHRQGGHPKALERITGRRPLPPSRRIGYAVAATPHTH